MAQASPRRDHVVYNIGVLQHHQYRCSMYAPCNLAIAKLGCYAGPCFMPTVCVACSNDRHWAGVLGIGFTLCSIVSSLGYAASVLLASARWCSGTNLENSFLMLLKG